MSAPLRTFTVRHVQLLRALFAALAAIMITFSSDHSAAVGLSVFSGFTGGTAIVFALAAWLATPKDNRAFFVIMALLGFIASAAASIQSAHSAVYFFVLVIVWAALSGLVELLFGLRARKAAGSDGIILGIFGMLLAVGVLFVPVDAMIEYAVKPGEPMVLTGPMIAVGLLGAYAAIVAVFLAIAGFSPKRNPKGETATASAAVNGGVA